MSTPTGILANETTVEDRSDDSDDDTKSSDSGGEKSLEEIIESFASAE